MTQAIVNLAQPIVREKVDQILQTYPLHPYQQAFAASDLRQKLVAYVLSRMPSLYVTFAEDPGCALTAPANCYSREQHGEIDQLIRQGIEHLLSQPAGWLRSTAEAAEPELMPSSWFG